MAESFSTEGVPKRPRSTRFKYDAVTLDLRASSDWFMPNRSRDARIRLPIRSFCALTIASYHAVYRWYAIGRQLRGSHSCNTCDWE